MPDFQMQAAVRNLNNRAERRCLCPLGGASAGEMLQRLGCCNTRLNSYFKLKSLYYHV